MYGLTYPLYHPKDLGKCIQTNNALSLIARSDIVPNIILSLLRMYLSRDLSTLEAEHNSSKVKLRLLYCHPL